MAPRVTHVVFDMDGVLAVRSTEATCAALAESSGLSSEVVMERLYLPADTSWDEGADAGKGMATGDEFVRMLNAQLQGSRAVTREVRGQARGPHERTRVFISCEPCAALKLAASPIRCVVALHDRSCCPVPSPEPSRG